MQTSSSRLPLVTVITPSYNRATYIEDVVTSVLEQDYPEIEYIVIDDGSKDDTLARLAKYTTRMRLLSQPNMGETLTVNRGLELASGEYVCVVNSDDPLLPGALSGLAAALNAQPEAVVAYPDWQMIDPTGRAIRTERTWDYDFAQMIRRHHCVPGPGAMFRRTAALQVGGRDPEFRYVGDFELWFRMGLLGTFVRVPEVLATFRVHPDSASVSAVGKRMAEEHVRMTEKFFARADLPEQIRKVHREALASAWFVAGAVCGEDHALRKHFFVRAIGAAPDIMLRRYRDRVRYILPEVVPRPFQVAARAVLTFGDYAAIIKRRISDGFARS